MKEQAMINYSDGTKLFTSVQQESPQSRRVSLLKKLLPWECKTASNFTTQVTWQSVDDWLSGLWQILNLKYSELLDTNKILYWLLAILKGIFFLINIQKKFDLQQQLLENSQASASNFTGI